MSNKGKIMPNRGKIMPNKKKICVFRYHSNKPLSEVKTVLEAIEKCGSFDLEMVREDKVWGFYAKSSINSNEHNYLEEVIPCLILLFNRE